MEIEKPKTKKPAKIEHVANWFFGNFCIRCGRVDSEQDNYGMTCRDNIQTIVKKLTESGQHKILHKEFSDLIKKGTTFCRPTKREFPDCPICKGLGIPQRGW